MNTEEAVSEIRNYLSTIDETIEITNELDLEVSGLLVSLHMMGLVVLIENIKDISISIDEINFDNFRTLNDIRNNFLEEADVPVESVTARV